MPNSRKRRFVTEALLAACVLSAVGLGIGVGIILAETRNAQLSRTIDDSQTFLPTQILDTNGKLIGRFFGAERRQLISLDALPKYLVYALITREDQNFFHEGAVSPRGMVRAAWNIATGHYYSGGSTITQQLAGLLFADRSKKTVFRKLKELWYAFQLEKRFSKSQILEMYLNTAYFGRNTYGVEAASQYYFGHPASDLTLAESAMLVIQLANPARYYPYRYPNRARIIQKTVLDEMVAKGYVPKDEAEQSFKDYWAGFDYTRPVSAGADVASESKAPYFTEYVRQQLDEQLFGKLDYLRDGLVVHTTLNLDDQELAQRLMHDAIDRYNVIYRDQSRALFSSVNSQYYPIVNLLALGFDLDKLAQTNRVRQSQDALQAYLSTVNPTVDVASLMLGLDNVHHAALKAHAEKVRKEQKTTVEGALITLDVHTGEIVAMVGGYDWSTSKFNRAVDAKVQPGSSFKPLYYSAAISSGKFTASSRLYDGPVVFYNPDGTPYKPYDYLGEWKGSVLLRHALGDSMNVPSLEVLNGIGFDAAIDRAARLLGMERYKNDPSIFPHVYPLGLGVTPVAPINMARAFAVFANSGREVDPVAIKYVQDRSGNIILEPEKEMMAALRRKGSEAQILSPQTAYIMTSLLEGVVEDGTLTWAKSQAGGFDGMPMAGKTGTTQNWSDAWTIGYSPYYATAVWFGFDQHGGSLGLSLTGATAAGPVWATYMKGIHRELPRIDFPRPASGLVAVRVDEQSGLLPTSQTSQTYPEIFLAGTEPHRFDDLTAFQQQRNQEILQKLQNSAIIQGLSDDSSGGTGALPAEIVPPPLIGAGPQGPVGSGQNGHVAGGSTETGPIPGGPGSATDGPDVRTSDGGAGGASSGAAPATGPSPSGRGAANPLLD